MDECEAFFDAGEDHDVAGAHEVGQLILRESAQKLDILLWEAAEDGLHVGVDGSGDSQTLCGMAKLGEGLEEVGNSFTECDRAGEEDFESIYGWFAGAGEFFESNSVGDDVHLVGG